MLSLRVHGIQVDVFARVHLLRFLGFMPDVFFCLCRIVLLLLLLWQSLVCNLYWCFSDETKTKKDKLCPHLPIIILYIFFCICCCCCFVQLDYPFTCGRILYLVSWLGLLAVSFDLYDCMCVCLFFLTFFFLSCALC